MPSGNKVASPFGKVSQLEDIKDPKALELETTKDEFTTLLEYSMLYINEEEIEAEKRRKIS